MRSPTTNKQKSSSAKQEGSGGGSPPHNDECHRKRGTPWDADDSNKKSAAQKKQTGKVNNPLGPPAFVQSTKVKALVLQRHLDVQLRMVVTAAGFGSPIGTFFPWRGLAQAMLPFLWLCFGGCIYPKANAITPHQWIILQHRNCVRLSSLVLITLRSATTSCRPRQHITDTQRGNKQKGFWFSNLHQGPANSQHGMTPSLHISPQAAVINRPPHSKRHPGLTESTSRTSNKETSNKKQSRANPGH
jgi:hypothetical protein